MSWFKVNFVDKCLVRSRYFDSICEEIQENYELKDVGNKVKNFNDGVFDVITNPVKEYAKYELDREDFSQIIDSLYSAFLNQDYQNMSEIFDKYYGEKYEY